MNCDPGRGLKELTVMLAKLFVLFRRRSNLIKGLERAGVLVPR
jgi:hypothetical protein